MPIIRVEMFEGRSPEIKAELVKNFTAEMARLTGCSTASVNVVITEVKKENWGLGGDLASVKFPD
jgi:4-oxalocrotonate tautomerase